MSDLTPTNEAPTTGTSADQLVTVSMVRGVATGIEISPRLLHIDARIQLERSLIEAMNAALEADAEGAYADVEALLLEEPNGIDIVGLRNDIAHLTEALRS